MDNTEQKNTEEKQPVRIIDIFKGLIALTLIGYSLYLIFI